VESGRYLWMQACDALGGGPPGDLGGLGNENTNSVALGINDRGDIVGWSELTPGFDVRATLWPADGGPPRMLHGPVDGVLESLATDINNLGDIVGYSRYGSFDFAPPFQPTLFIGPGVQPLILGTIGGTEAGSAGEARGINDAGDIVGYTVAASGWRRATLWPASDRVPRDLGTLSGLDSEAFGLRDSVAEKKSHFTEVNMFARHGAGLAGLSLALIACSDNPSGPSTNAPDASPPALAVSADLVPTTGRPRAHS
jgi:probable HAF family extracellular repeat protein